MWRFIDEILENFKNCFTRQATYNWFVIIVISFMISSDTFGVTSIIRDLALASKHYETILHFFRSSGWNLRQLADCWSNIVCRYSPIYKENGITILVADGVKQVKEARHMPGVKKLHQESENSSKAEYIFGHMFGSVGVLAGNEQKLFCHPLYTNLQDGVKTIHSWESPEKQQKSHVVQTIQNGFNLTHTFGKSLILLDRYFLSVDALKELKHLNNGDYKKLDILTKAKICCKAYEHAPLVVKKSKGCPRKKGNTIKLKTLFETEKNSFKRATVNMYGKNEDVRYYCINLLWGQGLYQELRFVLVEYNGVQSILVTTDLNLNPETIIKLYSYRFKIESTFREFKQVIGGFAYHFWSKHMPKLNKFRKKTDPHPVDLVEDDSAKKNILLTLKAIEGYVMCKTIALGLLQMISIKFSMDLNQGRLRYLRTYSNSIVSEATVAYYLRKNIFLLMAKTSHFAITKIIKQKQMEPELEQYSEVS